MAFTIANKIFEQANHYLNFLDEEKRKLLQSELKELSQVTETVTTELNPSYPNYQLVSEHRKSTLLQRLESIIQKIDKKLISSGERPSQSTVRQMQTLQTLLQNQTMPKELNKKFKEMDQTLVNKLYTSLWLACGCPREAEFSRELLKKNSAILLQKFPPLIDRSEGTLLQQMIADLQREYDILKEKEIIADLAKLKAGTHSDAELKTVFEALPASVQNEICEEFVKSEPGSNVIIRNHILSDLKILRGIVDPIAKHQFQLEKLTKEYDLNKIAIFNDRANDVYFSHRQLKSLFQTMPPSVQTVLPKPPYYGRGFNTELYKTLGAHYDSKTGVTTFRLYAPKANAIELYLTAWGNVEHKIPLVKGENGVWTAQTPNAGPGRTYYFMMTGQNGGQPMKKIDPIAFGNIIHCREIDKENHESVVRDIEKEFPWSDNGWMQARRKTDLAHQPMTIYEIHVSTWKKKENGDPLTWRELAVDLGKHCRDLGYTHVELMAAIEHPQPISMGYQVTSYFVPNSKMGTIEDFQFFVDEMHRQGIGVFLDWVPAHFAMDKYALANFDGSPLLEGELHPTWGTYEFDYCKQYTRDFLASNVEFILSKLHVDGLRVDAVWSMLNLDYDRDPGSRKNEKGGNMNIHAKAFLRNINAYVHKKYPGVPIMAEESSNYPNLILSTEEKGPNGKRGFGYDAAWHMGWMSDTLDYMRKTSSERSSPTLHNLLTSTIQRVDGGWDIRPRGKVVLPLSHDESANAKKTIQRKMPGTDSERFANGRLLQAFQLLRGGGPILDFMGNELLQSDEWHGRLIQSLNHPEDPREKAKPSVQWEELDPSINTFNHHYHKGAMECRKALNHLYLNTRGLWDQTDQGFGWIDSKDEKNSVVSFHRRGSGEQLACVFNFSNQDLQDYCIPLPSLDYAPELARLTGLKEVFNSDAAAFAGLGRTNASVEIIRNSSGQPTHIKLRLPPFTAVVLSENFA